MENHEHTTLRIVTLTMIKHVVVLLLLFMFVNQAAKCLAAGLYTPNSEGVQGPPSADTVGAVVTVTGLLLAASVPGFFQFSFKDIRVFTERFWLGQLLTAVHLLFIGMMTLVSYHTLLRLAECPRIAKSEFAPWSFGIFWLTLLLFDLSDGLNFKRD